MNAWHPEVAGHFSFLPSLNGVGARYMRGNGFATAPAPSGLRTSKRLCIFQPEHLTGRQNCRI
jgi:hypothetical protein